MDLNFTARKPPQTSAARMDIEQMPEAPQRGYFHRRSHSDTSFRFADFDDLLLFDPSDLDLSSSLPSPSPAKARMAVESFNSNSNEHNNSASKPSAGNGNSALFFSAHCRSLSMDSDFFEGLGMAGDGSDVEALGRKVTAGETKMGRHRHSNSMDSSLTSSLETGAIDYCSKKVMAAPDKLAELASMDPKRAKRILANRQSAQRSKERKIRYTNELEKKVQMLQAEATSLSAQVTVLQRDTTGLTTENRELKLRLQAMEQQAQLRDALNETLKEEVHRLKIAAAQVPGANGNSFHMGVGLSPQFPPPHPSLLQFGNSQNHQQQRVPHMSQPDAQGRSSPSQLPGV